MTTTYWMTGTNGSWFAAGNWSGGVPSDTTDVELLGTGPYTITLSGGTGHANSMFLGSQKGELFETATGSLSIATSLFESVGILVLNGANTITSGVSQDGGLLELGNAMGLGAATYTLGSGEGGNPEFLGIANITVQNALALSTHFTIAAAHGTTLNLDPSNYVLDASTTHITFGQGASDGAVVWHTTGATINNDATHLFTTEIAKGSVLGGDNEWGFLFGSAFNTVQIDAGATLDAHGSSGSISNLQGAGVVTNTGPATSVVLEGDGNFSGVISGALNVFVGPLTGAMILTGTNTYSGGTTIESGATLQLGNGGTGGTVVGNIVDNGTLIYDHGAGVTQTIGISGTGGVTYQNGSSGTTTVNRAETYTGDTTLTGGGTFSTNNLDAFGTSGKLTLDASKLVFNVSGVMGYSGLTFTAGSTFAAAHGVTAAPLASGIGWTGQFTNIPVTGGVTFGAAGDDGVIVWNGGANTVSYAGGYTVTVADGTLRGGDDHFGFLLSNDSTTVAAGATIDTATFDTDIRNLSGAGLVTGQSGTLQLDGGNFAGTITGAIELVVGASTVLSGANTYTGGTTINPGYSLVLGNGGTTGSIAGNVTDSGELVYNRSNAVALTTAVTGAGALAQAGTGTLTINRAETYSGGTNLLNGVLSIGEADAIGAGQLGLYNGTFVATNDVTLLNPLDMGGGHLTIEANTGKTLSFTSATPWNFNASGPTSLTFGDATHGGTILWTTPSGSGISNSFSYATTVAGGTVKAADDIAGYVFAQSSATTIAAAGTFDLNGHDVVFGVVQGPGKVINSAAGLATFGIDGGTFSGQINGHILVDITGTATLTGGGTYDGGLLIEGTLNLTDLVSRSVNFAAGGALHINNAAGVAETLTMTLSANDTVTAGAGTENFLLTTAIDSTDTVNGGTGAVIDRITFQNPVTEAAGALAAVSHIELIVLANGTNSIALSDANAATSDNAHTLTVAGGSGNDTVNGSAVTAANRLSIAAGTGNDTLTGGAGVDVFSFAPAALTAADTVNGGMGAALDLLLFTAAGSVTAAAFAGVSHIEQIALANGTNSIALSDAMVGSADDGHLLTITGGTGNDAISATAVVTAANMVVFESGSGNDSLAGGAGADQFFFAAADLTSADMVSGGGGTDTIRFTTAGTIAASAFAHVTHVEQIALANGTNSVTLADAMVTAADSHLVAVVGGTGADTINASGVTTTTDRVFFVGGGGADVMTASAGADTFSYAAAGDSTSNGFDTITGMNFAADRFDTPGAAGTISLVESLRSGALDSGASFDTELAARFSTLAGHHAGLLTATSGTLSGQTFLVVDLNGTAGYQAGSDLVLHLVSSTGTLVAGDFI